MAEVIAARPRSVVREPDGIVRFDDDVVRSGKPLAREAFGEDGDGSIVFRPRQPLSVVLTSDKPPLPVASVAVGIVGGPSEHRDGTGLLVPAHNAVVGDVAEQQLARVAEPHRSFREAEPSADPLNRRQSQDYPLEAWVDHLQIRIRVAYRSRGIPSPRGHSITPVRSSGGSSSSERASLEDHGRLPSL